MSWTKRLHFTAYTFIEHGATRLFDALITLLIVRLLTVESFAALSIYQSWVAIALLGFPAVENALYRGYGTIKSEGRLPGVIALIRSYNRVRLALAALLVVGLSLVSMEPLSWPARFAALAFAFALPLSQALYSAFREPLRFELKQSIVAAVTLGQKLALITAVAIIGYNVGGRVSFIAAGGFGVLFLWMYVWRYVAQKVLPTLWDSPLPATKETLQQASAVFATAVLWMHFNGAITSAVQTLDVFFLASAGLQTRDIALYALALKAANFFQIALVPLGQVFMVKLSRTPHTIENDRQVRRLVWWGTLGFIVTALLLCVMGAVVAAPVLEFLSRGRFSEEELLATKPLFMWLLGGVALYSTCFATGAYINARGNIKALCAWVFVPWAVLSAAAYFVASQWGTMVAAQMNVLVYGVLALGHIAVYLRK